MNNCSEISKGLKGISAGRVVSFKEVADENGDKQAVRILEAIEKTRKGKNRFLYENR